ncbi:nuclear transport factor 2 family protein [Longimicrobium sp.]|uniref:nuclear transport factor 2 family protein n=1 Tax=Longimicrobium sp. TaxID=2029185 RepID=UPI002E37C0A8|nr:nuclear transport factor 2 family protein [Longimicrobium sp.]HEX6038048.1 nuclear transport factor 2 family protein [Longimicrobium sp.]
MDDRELLRYAYAAFNARNVDAALATMHPDVDWPNGMEGGRVLGHEAVRQYWTRQWTLIDPHVEPVDFTPLDDGRMSVDVRQVVRDHEGSLLADQRLQHVYRIEDGRIRSMEIVEAPV